MKVNMNFSYNFLNVHQMWSVSHWFIEVLIFQLGEYFKSNCVFESVLSRTENSAL